MISPERSIENLNNPDFQELAPVFKTRAFEILALSTRPEGLYLQTNQTLPRPPGLKEAIQGELIGDTPLIDKISGDIHNGEVPSVLQKAINKAEKEDPNLKEEELSMLEVGITPEQIAKFRQINTDKKLNGRMGLSSFERSAYQSLFEKTNKVGLVNEVISVDGSVLMVDVRKVPYVMYKYFRTQEHKEKGYTEFANPTGVCGVLETSDGWFGLERRGSRNGIYRDQTQEDDEGRITGGQPGAWGAGIMDLWRSRDTSPGKPETITNHKVFRSGDLESSQETGVSTHTIFGEPIQIDTETIKEFAVAKIVAETGEPKEDIIGMKIVCYGRDLISIHNEIGLVFNSSRTADELIEIHSNMKRNTDANDFSEGVFFIPAQADMVEKFVTECRTPFPPTHYMPLVAAMYNRMVTEGGGTEDAIVKADTWRNRVEYKLDAQWGNIDELVDQYYADCPWAIEENKAEAKREKINEHGFDPAVLASRQLMEKQPDGSYKPIILDNELIKLNIPFK